MAEILALPFQLLIPCCQALCECGARACIEGCRCGCEGCKLCLQSNQNCRCRCDCNENLHLRFAHWGRNVRTQIPIGTLESCEAEADVPLLTRCVVWTFCLPCALAGLLAKHQDPTRPASCQDFIFALCCCPIAMCVVRKQRRALHGIAEEPCQLLDDVCACVCCCPCMACQICRASHRSEWDPCVPIAPQQAFTGREPLTCCGTYTDWGVNIDNGYPIGTLLDCDRPCDATCCEACCVWTFCLHCALAGLLARQESKLGIANLGHFLMSLCCCPLVMCSVRNHLWIRHARPADPESKCRDVFAFLMCCPCMACQICRASQRSDWHCGYARGTDELYRGGLGSAMPPIVTGAVVTSGFGSSPPVATPMGAHV